METRVLIPSSLAVVVLPRKPALSKDPCPKRGEKMELDAVVSSQHVDEVSSSSSPPSRNKKLTSAIKTETIDVDEGDEAETEVAVTTTDEGEVDDEEDEEGACRKKCRKKTKKTNRARIVRDVDDYETTSSSPSPPPPGERPLARRGCVIVAKHFLPKGTIFHANEGGIQLIPDLGEEQLPPLRGHDIRLVFGCVDRLIVEGGERFRVCNWVRFLSTRHDASNDANDDADGDEDSASSCPNIIGTFASGQVDFTLTKDVGPGVKLLCTFDISSLTELRGLVASKDTSNLHPLDLSAPAQLYKKTDAGDKHVQHRYHRHHHHIHQMHDKKLSSPSPPAKRVVVATTTATNLLPFSISSVLAAPPASTGRLPILRTRGRERSLLPCEVCGKAFDRPSLLKRHMRTHTGEKPHECAVCGKGFSTSSSLNTHRRIHSGEKPHECPVCGKRFTASSNLYYHRMTHNKEKPHKCLCGKSFPTPGDLKSHQYVHSGSWPYTCPICHRGFSKQTNLRNHLLLHSGDKPHSCHICSKKFALACNLRAHLRTHEEEEQQQQQQQQNKMETSPGLETETKMGTFLPNSTTTRHSSPSSAAAAAAFAFLGSGHHRTQESPLASYPPTTTTSTTSSPGSHTLLLPPPMNPFLEQLFQWNYRFAKETAGSLNMMQQKLLESQMLAAHLMIGQPQEVAGQQQGQGHPVGGGMERLLPHLVPFSVSDLLRSSAGSHLNRMVATSSLSLAGLGAYHPLHLNHQGGGGGGGDRVGVAGTASLFSHDLNKFM